MKLSKAVPQSPATAPEDRPSAIATEDRPPATPAPSITLDPHTLLSAVQRVAIVCHAASLMPILSNIRMTFAPLAEPGLIITATDLSATIETSLPYDGPFAGVLLINARSLINILKTVRGSALPLTMTLISADDATDDAADDANPPSRISLSCGSTTYELPLADPDEYPETPPAYPSGIVLPGKAFADLLNRVSFAASRDEARYALCCVQLRLNPAAIEALASDGFRAVIAAESIDNLPPNPVSFLVPWLTVSYLQDIVDPAGQVEISVGVNTSGRPQACITVWDKAGASTRIYTRLLDAVYPDIEASVPAHKYKIILSREGTINALYRVSAISSPKEPVVIEISRSLAGGCKVALTMESDEGHSETLLSPLSYTLPDMSVITTMSIRAGWLIQHLEHMSGETVTIEFSAEFSAVYFAENEGRYRHIIMPVRI